MAYNDTNRRYCVDIDGEQASGGSAAALVATRRCSSCVEADGEDLTGDPAEAIAMIAEHCSTTADYLLPDTPLREAVFRVLWRAETSRRRRGRSATHWSAGGRPAQAATSRRGSWAGFSITARAIASSRSRSPRNNRGFPVTGYKTPPDRGPARESVRAPQAVGRGVRTRRPAMPASAPAAGDLPLVGPLGVHQEQLGKAGAADAARSQGKT